MKQSALSLKCIIYLIATMQKISMERKTPESSMRNTLDLNLY